MPCAATAGPGVHMPCSKLAMPRKHSFIGQHVEPVNFGRAILVGMISSLFMQAFMDIFFMLGITHFSFESYMGSLILDQNYGDEGWLLGWMANLVTGALFGLLYAWGFEYVFKRADTRLGTLMGFGHALVAASLFFPIFQIMRHHLGLEAYDSFGLFGSGVGAATPILLLMGHLLFGSCMGVFYGPVRADRVHLKDSEPGKVVQLHKHDVIDEDFDHKDSSVVNW